MGGFFNLETISFALQKIFNFKNNTNNKCWQACREKGTLKHYLWEFKLAQTTLENNTEAS
jgi:hypothetical protein